MASIIGRRELWRINLRDAAQSASAFARRIRGGDNISYEDWSRTNYKWAYEESEQHRRRLLKENQAMKDLLSKLGRTAIDAAGSQ